MTTLLAAKIRKIDMVGVYSLLGEEKSRTVAARKAWAKTQGGLAMNVIRHGLFGRQLITTVMNELHKNLSTSAANGQACWTWTPDSPLSYKNSCAWKLLDSELQQGECGTVALALKTLLTFRSPFGLGIKDHSIGVETFSGSLFNNRLNYFISEHPIDGVLGLLPNVVAPTGKRLPFYIWMNHKTVEYDNKYYDACYNKAYDKESEMAVAQIVKTLSVCSMNQPMDPAKHFTPLTDIYVESVRITNDTLHPSINGFYMQCFKNLDTDKLTTQTEYAEYVRINRKKRSTLSDTMVKDLRDTRLKKSVYIGPFNYGNGNSANNFGFPTGADTLGTLNSVLKDIEF